MNKITRKPPLILIYISFVFFNVSCTNKSLSNSLDFNCSIIPLFENLKKCSDPSGNFEIKIPTHWKKEFFVSQKESRLYFADTTKSLNEAFITDIALHHTKTIIDSEFIDKKFKESNKDAAITKVESEKINFQDKNGFTCYTEELIAGISKNSMEIYLQNKNKSYYLIKIDVYGDKKKDERFCRALSLLDNGSFY